MHPYRLIDWKAETGSLSQRANVMTPHIESVTVIQDDKVVQISREGTTETTLEDKRSARGSTVCITFWTEAGERVYQTFAFHKGEVFEQLSSERIPGSENWSAFELEDGVDQPEMPTELWRD